MCKFDKKKLAAYLIRKSAKLVARETLVSSWVITKDGKIWYAKVVAVCKWFIIIKITNATSAWIGTYEPADWDPHQGLFTNCVTQWGW